MHLGCIPITRDDRFSRLTRPVAICANVISGNSGSPDWIIDVVTIVPSLAGLLSREIAFDNGDATVGFAGHT